MWTRKRAHGFQDYLCFGVSWIFPYGCCCFICCLFDGRAYESRVLPFGLATSSHLSTRVVKAVVPIVVAACRSNQSLLRSGFIPIWVKSKLAPDQMFTYLGGGSVPLPPPPPFDTRIISSVTSLGEAESDDTSFWRGSRVSRLSVRTECVTQAITRPAQWHL